MPAPKTMIIWVASYPKSGNTYIRSFLSAYYFSKKGKFEFNQLLNILQFPSIKYSQKDYFNFNDAAKNWVDNQKIFFDKENFRFLKTHNTLNDFQGANFTTKKQTLGAIYIVRDPSGSASQSMAPGSSTCAGQPVGWVRTTRRGACGSSR